LSIAATSSLDPSRTPVDARRIWRHGVASGTTRTVQLEVTAALNMGNRRRQLGNHRRNLANGRGSCDDGRRRIAF
jgi:hypothetical protein